MANDEANEATPEQDVAGAIDSIRAKLVGNSGINAATVDVLTDLTDVVDRVFGYAASNAPTARPLTEAALHGVQDERGTVPPGTTSKDVTTEGDNPISPAPAGGQTNEDRLRDALAPFGGQVPAHLLEGGTVDNG